MATIDLTFEKGLPANVDAERFVLGSILLNRTPIFKSRARLSPKTSASKSTAAFSRA